jgi:hypothetical protein
MNGKTAVGKASLVLAAGLFVSTASAEMMARLQRFAQRDPLDLRAPGLGRRGQQRDSYAYTDSAPGHRRDPQGLTPGQGCNAGEGDAAETILNNACTCIGEAETAAQAGQGDPRDCIKEALACMKGRCDGSAGHPRPHVHCEGKCGLCADPFTEGHAVGCYLGIANHITLCTRLINGGPPHYTPGHKAGIGAHELAHCCGRPDNEWPGVDPECSAGAVEYYVRAHSSCSD